MAEVRLVLVLNLIGCGSGARCMDQSLSKEREKKEKLNQAHPRLQSTQSTLNWKVACMPLGTREHTNPGLGYVYSWVPYVGKLVLVCYRMSALKLANIATLSQLNVFSAFFVTFLVHFRLHIVWPGPAFFSLVVLCVSSRLNFELSRLFYEILSHFSAQFCFV